MKLAELLQEAILSIEEKLIILNQKSAGFGNILFLAGGGGSGKGNAISNFIRSESYKQFNVDDLKDRLVKISKRKILALQDKGLPVDSGIARLASVDFKNPNDVAFLHQFVKDKGLEDKQLKLFAKSASKSTQEKPNILFDMTFKDIKDAEKKFGYVRDLGYEPRNTHIVWVLTDYDIALANNNNRARVVPEIILQGAHKSVGRTLVDALLNSKLPKFIDGEFHIIFGNQANTLFWKDAEGKDIEFSSDTTKKARKTMKSFKSVKVKEAGKPVDIKLVSTYLNDIANALPDKLHTLKGIKKSKNSKKTF